MRSRLLTGAGPASEVRVSAAAPERLRNVRRFLDVGYSASERNPQPELDLPRSGDRGPYPAEAGKRLFVVRGARECDQVRRAEICAVQQIEPFCAELNLHLLPPLVVLHNRKIERAQ